MCLQVCFLLNGHLVWKISIECTDRRILTLLQVEKKRCSSWRWNASCIRPSFEGVLIVARLPLNVFRMRVVLQYNKISEELIHKSLTAHITITKIDHISVVPVAFSRRILSWENRQSLHSWRGKFTNVADRGCLNNCEAENGGEVDPKEAVCLTKN